MLITDLSGVYREEGFEAALQAAGVSYDYLDMGGLEGTCCYLDSEAGKVLREKLEASKDEKLRFIDSGDYHYISALLAEKVSGGPFTLVLMDNHPDNQQPEFEGMLSCGSWAGAIGNPLLEKVVIFGPEGYMKSMAELRQAVCGVNRVYISLDKDIMSKQYARTDWSQGSFTLEEVKEALLAIKEAAREIIAVDVCGELPRSKGGKEEDFELNLRTNLELVRFINESIFRC